jgi:23S rRNA (adenine(2503)-C(2))-methyltransferase
LINLHFHACWNAYQKTYLLSKLHPEMAPKRKNADLPLKSIWEELSVNKVFTDNKASLKNTFKIWKWMLQNPDIALVDVPMSKWCVPKVMEKELKENFSHFTSKIVEKSTSIRGDTTKLLIELQDGHRIETVVIMHRGHTTVCVSSQVGCQMGCRFCATGTMGIIGDLQASEIIEQVVYANMVSKVRNVVFMGMGEPLNNFDNVKLAFEFLVDVRRFGLSPRHITISTVGVVKSMYRLTDELKNVNLALSLHAPTQDIRLQIVPSASAHHIDKLIAALDYHIKMNDGPVRKSQLKVTSVMIEYILIKDVNDREEHAHLLGKLLAPRRNHVLLNLIPYNPTDVPGQNFEPPEQSSIDRFYQVCTSDEYGIFCRVRQEMGQDIDGACGQLALKHAPSSTEAPDIEDIGAKGSSSAAAGRITKTARSRGKTAGSSTAADEVSSHMTWGSLFGSMFTPGSLAVSALLAFSVLAYSSRSRWMGPSPAAISGAR